MKKSSFFWVVAASFIFSLGGARANELTFTADFKWSTDPLTTEKVWILDSNEKNPQHKNWVLDRSVALQGLHARALPKGRYGAFAERVSASTVAYIKPDGPHYRSLGEFPCTKEPSRWFATQAREKLAAELAAHLWEESVDLEKRRLESWFSQISARTEKNALISAQLIYNSWLSSLEQRWRQVAIKQAQAKAWQSYWEVQKIECGTRSARPPFAFSEESTLAAVSGMMPEAPLARLPAKIVNGLFTVRLNLLLGKERINGRFLIDSGAERSVVSPRFLDAQGVIPTYAEDLIEPFHRAIFSGGLIQKSGMAKTIDFDLVEAGGLKLPLREFLLSPTDFFSPPESAKTCCDGVLGTDFLRKYAVEFIPNFPGASEVVLWKREGFSHLSYAGVAPALNETPTLDPWFAVSLNERAIPESSCELVHGKSMKLFRQEATIFFETGRVEQSKIPLTTLSPSIICGGVAVSSGGLSSDHVLGMPSLARGSFTLDLANGRFWQSKNRGQKPELRNQTGLTLNFVFRKGERTLIVQKVSPQSQAGKVLGLKVGAKITLLNEINPDRLDLWEVERILTGAYGSEIKLSFLDGKKLERANIFPTDKSADLRK